MAMCVALSRCFCLLVLPEAVLQHAHQIAGDCRMTRFPKKKTLDSDLFLFFLPKSAKLIVMN